jgi:hypothetical protein
MSKHNSYQYDQLCSVEWVQENLSEEQKNQVRTKELRSFMYKFIPIGLYNRSEDAALGLFYPYTNKHGHKFMATSEGVTMLQNFEREETPSYTADEEFAIGFWGLLKVGDSFCAGNKEYKVTQRTAKVVTLSENGTVLKLSKANLLKQRNFIRNLVAQYGFELSQSKNQFHTDFRVCDILKR